MKRLFFSCVVFAVLGLTQSVWVHAGELNSIKVESESLKIGGILQCWYFNTQDETKVQSAFQMKRARLLFWGEVVPKQVKYFIQTEGVGSPYLLDMKLQFYCIPKTEIAFGRFLPNFTQYMPRPTSKLDMIHYPLVVLRYAMWRQVGVQTTTKTKWLDFNLGMFNGPTNNWTDNNEAKDLFARVMLKPLPLLSFGGYQWQGKQCEEDCDVNRIRTGGFVSISHKKAVFNAEYISGKDGDTKSKGFYTHLSVKVLPKIELLARYDSYDSNVDVGENGESWITGGINYFIQGEQAKISLNYVVKQEEYESVNNNEFIIQTQVFF